VNEKLETPCGVFPEAKPSESKRSKTMNLLSCQPKERLTGNGGAGNFSRFRNEIERVFDRFVVDPFEVAWYGRNGKDWIPKLDVMESSDAITVRLEVPGVSPKNVDVSVRGNVLTISGHKEESSKEDGKDFYISEREYGSFRRSIELPQGCDPDRVTAAQDNGVLTVKIARLKEATPKQITVKTGSSS
jgi:HSP20 family protein